MVKQYSQWCEVDLKNLDHNVSEIKRTVGKTKVLAVVKSDAYGHGIIEIAKRLEVNKDVEYFATNTIGEAVVLRENDIKKPILVLGYIKKEDIGLIIKNVLEIELWNSDFVTKLNDYKDHKFKVHIKVDTGMGRLGFPLDQLKEGLKKVKEYDNIEIIGIMSHLVAVEEGFIDYTRKQIDRFREAIDIFEKMGFSGLKHLGATSTALALPEAYFDMVRCGIGIYGLWPSKETQEQAVSQDIVLKPLMTFKTKAIYIRKINQGDYIGYGCAYKAKKDMIIAVIPIGYYEGLDRRFSNIGEVLIGGNRGKIVGRVCMNMTMIDITDFSSEVKPRDEVVIFGKSENDEITPEEYTEKIGIITYEMTTKIPGFIKKFYIE